MTNISISIDDDLLVWLDQLVERGIITSRSEAVRNALFEYIRTQLGMEDRNSLRKFLTDRQKKEFQSGQRAIRDVRREE